MTTALPDIHIHWFRRDLRIEDHRALYEAAKFGKPILPLFIFDTHILNALSDKKDRRVHFIHHTLTEIKARLEEVGATLCVKFGDPIDVWKLLAEEYNIASVTVVRDYEPYAQERDQEINSFFNERRIQFKGYKDQVIFEKSEIVKGDQGYYSVFTPYSKQWKHSLHDDHIRNYEVDRSAFLKTDPLSMPSLEEMGFSPTDESLFPASDVQESIIAHYDQTRDIPSIEGTSRLGVHLRFGTVSIRRLVREYKDLNETFLNELIWREFYQMTLYHNPESVNKAIKPKYDNIIWENNEEHFAAWCAGKTGYPLVDAGMRELNTTGYMHNRIRMLTASFLTKHLLIDWRWGERYFAEKLLDFDLAANVGGWQWAAGCGNDASPYFRIFNPYIQQKKFDPDNLYVKRFVPEFNTPSYPQPIVDHAEARLRALDRYKMILSP